MSRILERVVVTNGYGCQCCMENHESTDWIDENEVLSVEELLDLIDKNRQEGLNNPHKVDIRYEKEGELFYGMSARIYRMGEHNSILFGDKKLLYKADVLRSGEECMTREEILDEFEQWAREAGVEMPCVRG